MMAYIKEKMYYNVFNREIRLLYIDIKDFLFRAYIRAFLFIEVIRRGNT